MDQLKRLGIGVGDYSLLDVRKSSDDALAETIQKGGFFEQHRKSIDPGGDFRSRLEKSFSTGPTFSNLPEAPKNTHGEQFHSDNDKSLEKLQNESKVIDGDRREPTPTTYSDTPPPFSSKSLSQEELFAKALEVTDELIEKGKGKNSDDKFERCVHHVKDKNGEKGKYNPWAVCHASTGKSEIDELYDLVKGNFPPPAKDLAKDPEKNKGSVVKPETGAQQAASKEKLGTDTPAQPQEGFGSKGAAEDERDPKKAVAKSTAHENTPGVGTGKKNATSERKANAALAENATQTQATPIPKGFLKSAGPGGLIFDFGPLTGNPMADNATALLNRHGDPVQKANVQYQRQSYDQALNQYVKKGDQEYTQQATPFGNVDKSWADQLNKPMDQQVQEAHDQGAFSKSGTAPAVKGDFNKSVMKVGNEVVKATSETDAALIEMMKSEGHDLSGMMSDGLIADATTGGKQKITIDA